MDEDYIKKVEFTTKLTKENLEWFKKQLKELDEISEGFKKKYEQLAQETAIQNLPLLEKSESKQKYLTELILVAICKGWNDCFDYNVKHINI